MAEYASKSLNILANAWINCFDYAWDLNMSVDLKHSTGYWIWLRFEICQGSENGTVV